MYVATVEPNMKLVAHILNAVPGTTLLPLATVLFRMSIQSCTSVFYMWKYCDFECV